MLQPDKTKEAPEGAPTVQSPAPTTASVTPHIVPEAVIFNKNWCRRTDRRIAKMARKAARS